MKRKSKRPIGRLALVFLLSFLLVFGNVLNVFGIDEETEYQEEAETTIVESLVEEEPTEEEPTEEEPTEEEPTEEELTEEVPLDMIVAPMAIVEEDNNDYLELTLLEISTDNGGWQDIYSGMTLTAGRQYEVRYKVRNTHVPSITVWYVKIVDLTLKVSEDGVQITAQSISDLSTALGGARERYGSYTFIAKEGNNTINNTASGKREISRKSQHSEVLFSYIGVTANYPVTFIITDGTDPINGAEVTIDAETKSTNSNGEVTFNLPNGNYIYDVTAEGFEDVSEEELIVNGGTQDLTVVMTPMVDEGDKVYLHGPHKNSNSSTERHGDGKKIERKDNENGGLEDPVVWHLVLNQANKATGPVKVEAQFENAGTITIFGSPTGTNKTQHFFIGTPEHDVLINAVAFTSEGKLVLSHIALNEGEEPTGLVIVKNSEITVAEVGDVVTYTITVTNNFNKNLSNVKVVDNELDMTWNVGTLIKNSQWTVTFEYTITEENEGIFKNTAKVTGKLSGKKITASDSHIIEVISEEESGNILIKKVIQDGTEEDDEVEFTVWVNPIEREVSITAGNETGELLEGLDPGTYYIWEDIQSEDYELVNISSDAGFISYEEGELEMELEAGQTIIVTVTNKKVTNGGGPSGPGEEETGTIIFQKSIVDGSEEDENVEFALWVFGSEEFEARVTFTVNEPGSIALPVGNYTFAEEETEGYDTIDISPQFVSLEADDEVIVTVTNRKLIEDPTGTIIFRKVLENGTQEDNEVDFVIWFSAIEQEILFGIGRDGIVEGLEAREYWFEEREIEGYDFVSFSIEGQIIEADEYGEIIVTLEEGEILIVTVTNRKIVDDDPNTPPGGGDDDDDDDDDDSTTPPGGGGGGTTTPPATIELDDEEIPLGTVEIEIQEVEIPLGPLEIDPEEDEDEEEIIILNEEVPLGVPQLPKTGEASPWSFYLLGLLFTVIGVKLRKVF